MLLALVIALTVLIATLVSVGAIPRLSAIAFHRRLLDYPDEGRRRHPRPVPRLGGVAIFAGLLAAYGAVAFMAPRITGEPFYASPLSGALALSCGILFVIGLVDDVRGVPPLIKIVGQTAAALILVASGFRIDLVVLPGGSWGTLDAFAVPITVLWLVGVSNALNLVDGQDGLAAGVAVIALMTTALSAAVLGSTSVIWYCLILAGALLGFLRFNFPPASIFLGDSGSLVVGFLLAVLTVRGATRFDGAVFAVAPVFVLAYPLLDTGIAILRRWLRGEPLSRADGRHIHHQLRALGLGPRRSLAVIYALSAAVAILGLSAAFAPPRITIALAAAGLGIVLFLLVYGARWLQYHEFAELGASFASVTRQARGVLRDRIHARDMCALIDRAETLAEIDAILTDHAHFFRFAHMQVGPPQAPLPAGLAAVVDPGRVWKLEYPILDVETDSAGPVDGGTLVLTLSIWCPLRSAVRPAGAERVARILAPAIAAWQSRAPAVVTSEITARVSPAGSLRSVGGTEYGTADRVRRYPSPRTSRS